MYFFNVVEDGQVIDFTNINTKVEIEVPDTYITDSKMLDILGIILMLGGVTYLIYDKCKKK